MRAFYVVSPEYGTLIPVTSEGEGPIEYSADCLEVEARTKREAIAIGVRQALAQHDSWARRNVLDRRPPWKGYRAEEAICAHGVRHFEIDEDRVVYLECARCSAEEAVEVPA